MLMITVDRPDDTADADSIIRMDGRRVSGEIDSVLGGIHVK